MDYAQVIQHLKNLGCQWVYHSNYWDGAGFKTDTKGRATAIARFHISYEASPIRSSMGISRQPEWTHRNFYDTFVVDSGLAKYYEYYFPKKEIRSSGFCVPIEEAVAFWRKSTAAWYAKNPQWKQP